MGERIRIIDTPPGGAPDKIRQEWVEMYLPLARTFAEMAEEFGVEGVSDDTEILTQAGFVGTDVETDLPSMENQGGYVVNAEDAIRLLEEKGTKEGKEAAEYWKMMLNQRYGDYKLAQLIFDRSVCEIVAQAPEDQ